jgi:hypothetical protein
MVAINLFFLEVVGFIVILIIRYSPVTSLRMISSICVHTLLNSKPTSLSPVSSPRVSANPIFYTIFLTIARKLNSVVSQETTLRVISDASIVLFEAIGINIARDGSPSHHFGHDVRFASYTTIFRDSYLRVVIDSIASARARVAVSAHILGRADIVGSFILLASDVWNTVLVNPFVSCV